MTPVLSATDYVVISAIMIVPAVIGVFFAARSGRSQTSNDYFLGSQGVSAIAVAFSLSATVMSSISYIGTPAEVYMFGPKYGLLILARIPAPLIVSLFIVPVFYRLKVVTMYEYIAMRFNNTVRYATLVIRGLHGFLYMGIMIYTPALALSLAAGLSLEFSILSVGLVCTFYTSIGGFKAVIWTDVFQACAMFIGATVMVVAGTVKIGGPAEGWSRAVEGGRDELFDFTIDLTIRLTVWSGVIGGSFVWVQVGGARSEMVQRYNSCRTERDARLAAWLGLTSTIVIEVLAVAVGMTIFAWYHDCDPLTSEKISRSDQIIPFYIMDMFHSYPGVPGLMIGCAFCAGLSSVSSMLNGLVAAAGQDIIKRIWPDLEDSKYTMLMKVLTVLFGLLTVALAFLASLLGSVVQVVYSLGGIAGGPVCGVIMLGMFVPRANSIGALSGLIGGFALGVMQYVGSQIIPSPRSALPLSTVGCQSSSNESSGMYTTDNTIPSSVHEFLEVTSVATLPPINSESPAFFRISYFYISVLTTTACILIGVIVSYATSWRNPSLTEPRFLSPPIARLYAKESSNTSDESNDKVDLKETNI